MRQRRLFLTLTGIVMVMVVAAFGYRGWRRAGAGLVDVLPTFVDPSPGPRAPRTEAFGFVIGSSTLVEVQGLLVRAGLRCEDTSMRALMARMREEKKRELAELKARGESTDAVTGASALNRRSPKESNPQVRLSCEGTPGEALGDRKRPAITGRLLLVFDSPQHPLRHVSFERTFPPALESLAREDYLAATRALATRFGEGGESQGSTPEAELPWLSPVSVTWRFADLEARVSVLNYGPRGITVSERVEVPWPVRADAPAVRLASTSRWHR